MCVEFIWDYMIMDVFSLEDEDTNETFLTQTSSCDSQS